MLKLTKILLFPRDKDSVGVVSSPYTDWVDITESLLPEYGNLRLIKELNADDLFDISLLRNDNKVLADGVTTNPFYFPVPQREDIIRVFGHVVAESDHASMHLTTYKPEDDQVLFSGFVTENPTFTFIGANSTAAELAAGNKGIGGWAINLKCTGEGWYLSIRGTPQGIPPYVEATHWDILKDLARRITSGTQWLSFTDPQEYDFTSATDHTRGTSTVTTIYTVYPSFATGTIATDYFKGYKLTFSSGTDTVKHTINSNTTSRDSDGSFTINLREPLSVAPANGLAFSIGTNLQGGTESLYVVDPEKKWTEIATEFAEMDNYRWRIENGVFYYEPLPDIENAVTILPDEDEILFNDDTTDGGFTEHFTHADLALSRLDNEWKNDVTVIGADSPTDPVNEEFLADGYTGSFKLATIPYGAEETTIISDEFTSGTLDTTKWDIVLATGETLEISDGSLNVIDNRTPGGGQTYLNLLNLHYLISSNYVELAGDIIIRAGEVNIVSDSGVGIVGALYTASPTTNLTGCYLGFIINADGGKITPIVNGVLIAEGSYTNVNPQVDYSYIPRIRLHVDEPIRINQQYLTEGTSTPLEANARVIFEIEEYVPTDINSATITTIYQADLTRIPASALFCPVNSGGCASAASPFSIITNYAEVLKPFQVEATEQAPGASTKTELKIGSALDGCDATISVDNSEAFLVYYDVKADGKTINTPTQRTKIRVHYHQTEKAQYRIKDDTDILNRRITQSVGGAETTLDDGVRRAIITDLSPLPRNDYEAEVVAKAYLEDHTREMWSGSYKGILGYLIDYIPNPGARVEINVGNFSLYNDPTDATRPIKRHPIYTRLQEVTFESLGGHVIGYSLQFTSVAKLDRILKKLLLNRRGLLNSADIQKVNPISKTTTPTVFVKDISNVEVTSINAAAFTAKSYTSIPQTDPLTWSIECRTDDSKWGLSSGDLVANFTNAASMSIPRSLTARRSVFYFKLTNNTSPSTSNEYSRHSCMIRINYPLYPAKPLLVNGTLDDNKTINVTVPRGSAGQDVAGIKITDANDNLIYQGDCGPENIQQSPALGQKGNTGTTDYVLFADAHVDGGHTASTTSFYVAAAGVAVSKYVGLRIQFSTGNAASSPRTITANTATSGGYIQITVDSAFPLAPSNGDPFYIYIADSYTSSISGNVLSIVYPNYVLSRGSATASDAKNKFHVRTYNLLGDVDDYPRIGAATVVNSTTVSFTTYDSAGVPTAHKLSNGQWLELSGITGSGGDWATFANGAFVISTTELSPTKFSITTTGAAGTYISGGTIETLANLYNVAPAISGLAYDAVKRQLTWAGRYATYYLITIYSDAAATVEVRTQRVEHPAAENTLATVTYPVPTADTVVYRKFVITAYDTIGAGGSTLTCTNSDNPDFLPDTTVPTLLEGDFVATTQGNKIVCKTTRPATGGKSTISATFTVYDYSDSLPISSSTVAFPAYNPSETSGAKASASAEFAIPAHFWEMYGKVDDEYDTSGLRLQVECYVTNAFGNSTTDVDEVYPNMPQTFGDLYNPVWNSASKATTVQVRYNAGTTLAEVPEGVFRVKLTKPDLNANELAYVTIIGTNQTTFANFTALGAYTARHGNFVANSDIFTDTDATPGFTAALVGKTIVQSVNTSGYNKVYVRTIIAVPSSSTLQLSYKWIDSDATGATYTIYTPPWDTAVFAEGSYYHAIFPLGAVDQNNTFISRDINLPSATNWKWKGLFWNKFGPNINSSTYVLEWSTESGTYSTGTGHEESDDTAAPAWSSGALTVKTKATVSTMNPNDIEISWPIPDHNLHDRAPFLVRLMDAAKTTNVSGTVSSGSTSTLVKTSAGWSTNEFAGYRVVFFAQAANDVKDRDTRYGYVGVIASNTADTLTVSPAFPVAPVSGDQYYICLQATETSDTTYLFVQADKLVSAAVHPANVRFGYNVSDSSVGTPILTTGATTYQLGDAAAPGAPTLAVSNLNQTIEASVVAGTNWNNVTSAEVQITLNNGGSPNWGSLYATLKDPSAPFILHWSAPDANIYALRARGTNAYGVGTWSTVGTITTDTMHGFQILDDRIVDVADSFGLSSAVSGANDVRFWSGATWANRAIAPYRLYEDGATVIGKSTESHLVLTDDGIAGWVGPETVAAYDAGTLYWVNIRVTYGGSTYKCIQAGTDQRPDLSPTYWSVETNNITNLTFALATTTATYAIGGVSYTINSGDLWATAGYVGGWAIADNVLRCDKDGVAIQGGKTSFASDVAGFWLGKDSSDSKFKFKIGSAAEYMYWNGANLFISTSLEASTGSIGGWTIAPHTIYSGTAGTYVCLDSGTDAVDYAIWAGATAPASATFSVERDGTVVATNGTFAGIVNAAGILTGLASGPHVVLNSAGIAGWSGVESAPTNLKFALATAAGSYSIGAETYTINAGDMWAIAGYVGGWAIVNNELICDHANVATRAGKATYGATTAGFWLGHTTVDSTYKFHIGDATHSLYWTGTELQIDGKVMAGATIGGTGVLTVDASGLIIGTSGRVASDAAITFKASSGTSGVPCGAAGADIAGVFLGYDTGATQSHYKLFAGDTSTGQYLAWNGHELIVYGTLYASAGYIGNTAGSWAITADGIHSTNATAYIAVNRDSASGAGISATTTAGNAVFWAGSTYANRDAVDVDRPEFKVTLGGDLYASSATVTGVITANTGKIGGITNYWDIAAGSLVAVGSGTVEIRAGKTGYADGTNAGFWLGLSSGSPRLLIGNSTHSLDWNGSALSIDGKLITGATIGSDYVTVDASGIVIGTATPGGRIQSYGTISWAGAHPVVNVPTGNGFFLGYDTGGDSYYKFFVGNAAGNPVTDSYLAWNGAELIVYGTLYASAGTIGGWNIGQYTLDSGATSTYVRLTSDPGDSYAFWAGAATSANAKFKVKKDGAVYITNSSSGNQISIDVNTGMGAGSAILFGNITPSHVLDQGGLITWGTDTSTEGTQFGLVSLNNSILMGTSHTYAPSVADSLYFTMRPAGSTGYWSVHYASADDTCVEVTLDAGIMELRSTSRLDFYDADASAYFGFLAPTTGITQRVALPGDAPVANEFWKVTTSSAGDVTTEWFNLFGTVNTWSAKQIVPSLSVATTDSMFVPTISQMGAFVDPRTTQPTVDDRYFYFGRAATAPSVSGNDQWGIQSQIYVPNYSSSYFAARAAVLGQAFTEHLGSSYRQDAVGVWGWAMIKGTTAGAAFGVEADVFMNSNTDDGSINGVGSGIRSKAGTVVTNPDGANFKVNFWGGSVTSENDDSATARVILAMTGNAISPIQVITTGTHGILNGELANISGSTGNTAANGTHKVTVINSTTITLDGTTGNGAWGGTGSIQRAHQPITAWGAMLNDRYQAHYGLYLRHAISSFIALDSPDQANTIGIEFKSPSSTNWVTTMKCPVNASLTAYDSSGINDKPFICTADNIVRIGWYHNSPAIPTNGDLYFYAKGTHWATLTPTGKLLVGSTSALGKFFVNGTADEIQILARGYSTQNAHILEIQNSGGNILFAADGLGNIKTGSASTNDTSLRLGWATNNAKNTYVDFYANGDSAYLARLIRYSGADGALELQQASGTGALILNQVSSGTTADGIVLKTSNTTRVTLNKQGDITYATYNNFQNNVDISGANKTLYLGGAGDGSSLMIKETTTNPDGIGGRPALPPANAAVRIYVKSGTYDKLVIQYNDAAAGLVKYRYITLTDIGNPIWYYSTSPP